MSELSIKSIIKCDYLTAAVALSIGMLWLTCAIYFSLVWNSGSHHLTGFIYLFISLIISGIGLPYIYRRTKLIGQLLKDGILVSANFEGFSQYSDHVRISYSYQYQGEKFNGNLHIASLSYGENFKLGHKLNVLINPIEPASSIIEDIFE